VLTNVSFTLPVPLPDALLMPATDALVQLNAAPLVKLLAVYANGELLHTAGGVNELDKTGVGSISTTTFCVLLHPLAIRVNT
jgi:hypothetical protein